jgi:hypothetical protein
MTVSRVSHSRKQPGWIYRKRWQRRVALKKRLIQTAIDTLVTAEMQRLGMLNDVQIKSARRDDERLS